MWKTAMKPLLRNHLHSGRRRVLTSHSSKTERKLRDSETIRHLALLRGLTASLHPRGEFQRTGLSARLRPESECHTADGRGLEKGTVVAPGPEMQASLVPRKRQGT